MSESTEQQALFEWAEFASKKTPELKLLSAPPEPKKTTRRCPRMQERFGYTEGQICGTCAYFVRRKWSRTYFKCALWSMAHCESSDIRCHDKACGKWEDAHDKT